MPKSASLSGLESPYGRHYAYTLTCIFLRYGWLEKIFTAGFSASRKST